MSSYKKLAIIIPAYKADFLERALHSMSLQSNRDFKVYIGDDNSPYDLESIVALFKDKLDITYIKFNTNFGADSLTRQWERCIELSTEEWIWLFSDDDEMDEDCVSRFYLNLKPESRFYKFKTRVIDRHSNPILLTKDTTNNITEPFTCGDFLTKRLLDAHFRSYAVEYIFARAIYDKLKFVDFPLAWASDDASWASYAAENGRISLIDAYVSWRDSGQNITSVSGNSFLNEKKMEASALFIKWLYDFSGRNGLNLSKDMYLRWFVRQLNAVSSAGSWSWFARMMDNLPIKVSFGEKLILFKELKTLHLRKKVKKLISLNKKLP